MWTEANIDALVGPTHHFGGLGVGNLASIQHRSQTSSPRKAALEGLRKASFVAGLGIPQFVWLPPARPRIDLLDQAGFSGSIDEKLKAAFATAPSLFSSAFSSAFMWAANSGTFTASCDAQDRKIHFTPSNLISSWHRALESGERASDFAAWSKNGDGIELHHELPCIVPLRDEGAANHMRLSSAVGDLGINLFVHGTEDDADRPARLFPRHTRAASEAIARQHKLDHERTFFLHQHPDAISAGVFHNDVIATSHRNLLIHHEKAFVPEDRQQLASLEKVFLSATGERLIRIEVSQQDLPLEDAVSSYFFNSQILSPPEEQSTDDAREMVLLCPQQCEMLPTAASLIQKLLAASDNPISRVEFVSLGESMANGGGPACLRLRAPLSELELARVDSRLRVSSALVERVGEFIERHYPDELQLSDLVEIEAATELAHIAARLRTLVME